MTTLLTNIEQLVGTREKSLAFMVATLRIYLWSKLIFVGRGRGDCRIWHSNTELKCPQLPKHRLDVAGKYVLPAWCDVIRTFIWWKQGKWICWQNTGAKAMPKLQQKVAAFWIPRNHSANERGWPFQPSGPAWRSGPARHRCHRIKAVRVNGSSELKMLRVIKN